jgi:hypothetical protein
MPQDSLWPVQAAIYGVLAGATALTAQLADGADSVFDHVPQGSAFPYIVLGESAAEPLETQTGGGCDITIDIHAYSRALGMKEAKAVMAAISGALHGQNFAVTGQRLVFCRLQSQQLRQDGETRHGVQRYRIITEPV